MKSVIFAGILGGLSFFLPRDAAAASIITETFDYPDGPLTTGSGGAWFTVSGSADQMQVSGGAAQLTFSNTEDVARSFEQSYSTGTLFYSVMLTMHVGPGTAGQYLMHLSDTETGISTDFFARLYVKGVGDGYQLGIRNRSLQSSPSDYPVVYDESVTLSLETQVAVVVKFDFETLQSTLWINPLNESSQSVTDVFEVSFAGLDQTLSRIAMREASGIGTSSIDQILVGTTFDDVFVAVPEPSVMVLLAISGGLFLVGARISRRNGVHS